MGAGAKAAPPHPPRLGGDGFPGGEWVQGPNCASQPPDCGGCRFPQGWGLGGRPPCRFSNPFQDRRQVSQHFLVPKPDDTIAIILQLSCARLVVVPLSIMHPAVQLHDQLAGWTLEVQGERPDRVLPPELEAIQLLVLQRAPQF